MAKDGGPAFPSDAPTGLAAEQAAAFGRPLENHPGMSLRDYFAAAALGGLEWTGYEFPSGAAKACYELADAMLAERDK